MPAASSRHPSQGDTAQTVCRLQAAVFLTLTLHSLPAVCSPAGSNPTAFIDPKRVAALKPLVRRGIPFELRPTQVRAYSQGGLGFRHLSCAPHRYVRTPRTVKGLRD